MITGNGDYNVHLLYLSKYISNEFFVTSLNIRNINVNTDITFMNRYLFCKMILQA